MTFEIRAGRADDIDRLYAVHRDSVIRLCAGQVGRGALSHGAGGEPLEIVRMERALPAWSARFAAVPARAGVQCRR